MRITATYINLYHVCKRELWLHANEIRFEHTSDLVYEGNLIHEQSYPQRPERYEELEMDGIKLDFYDTRNKVIHEIKKTDKMETAYEWQLKYYIHVLERNGIEGVTGVLEYPTLRQTQKVFLTDTDREELSKMEINIAMIIASDHCPEVIHSRVCKQCSYFDFCYASEE